VSPVRLERLERLERYATTRRPEGASGWPGPPVNVATNVVDVAPQGATLVGRHLPGTLELRIVGRGALDVIGHATLGATSFALPPALTLTLPAIAKARVLLRDCDGMHRHERERQPRHQCTKGGTAGRTAEDGKTHDAIILGLRCAGKPRTAHHTGNVTPTRGLATPPVCRRARRDVTVCIDPGPWLTKPRAPHYHVSMTSPPALPKILVVDDDQRLRDLLRRYLAEQGFNVYLAENAPAMNRLWSRERFDLLVLDLMLPGEDGLSICKRLRGGNDNTPIIMLTAKGDEIDRIIGLEIGADDYLPKPFNPRELVARIHAVLRRRGAAEAPGAPSVDLDTFRFGPFTLNLKTRKLERDGEIKSLTTGEFAVLKAFARHPRLPLSRDKLMELARGREYEVFDRSLDVQVSRLRKLIEPDPASPRYIQTVWGLGYVFIPDDDDTGPVKAPDGAARKG